MIDLRQIYYNINFMSSNIYLLLQELGDTDINWWRVPGNEKNTPGQGCRQRFAGGAKIDKTTGA